MCCMTWKSFDCLMKGVSILKNHNAIIGVESTVSRATVSTINCVTGNCVNPIVPLFVGKVFGVITPMGRVSVCAGEHVGVFTDKEACLFQVIGTRMPCVSHVEKIDFIPFFNDTFMYVGWQLVRQRSANNARFLNVAQCLNYPFFCTPWIIGAWVGFNVQCVFQPVFVEFLSVTWVKPLFFATQYVNCLTPWALSVLLDNVEFGAFLTRDKGLKLGEDELESVFSVVNTPTKPVYFVSCNKIGQNNPVLLDSKIWHEFSSKCLLGGHADACGLGKHGSVCLTVFFILIMTRGGVHCG